LRLSLAFSNTPCALDPGSPAQDSTSDDIMTNQDKTVAIVGETIFPPYR